MPISAQDVPSRVDTTRDLRFADRRLSDALSATACVFRGASQLEFCVDECGEEPIDVCVRVAVPLRNHCDAGTGSGRGEVPIEPPNLTIG